MKKKAAHGRKASYVSLFVLVFPLLVIYYEIIFCISTSSNLFDLGTLFMLFFSVAYGGVGYLLSTISKNRKINHIVASALIGLTAIPYLVEYFIFRQFKVFYDINTMTGGAADAMGGFANDIALMVFSWNGMLLILLFILPCLLYSLLGRRFLPPVRITGQKRILTATIMAITYVFSWLMITLNGVYGPMYSSEYNFQSAVSHFGLMSALRLDMENQLFGSNDSFETTDSTGNNTPTTGTSGTDTQPSQPKEYGYNAMDLDFEALIANSSGKIKELHQYVSSLSATHKNDFTGLFKGYNLIMISAEAFTAEVIDPVLTPTLYRLATKGINFTDYYQPASAGTTGGEYQNIFGMMPNNGGKSFKNTADHLNYFTMGNQLNRLGYYGQAFHNNSYTYYDRHKTHINLGYSAGYMGYGNGMEQYVKKQWPQSDLEMIAGTLPLYIDKPQFNVYYMTVSGHSGYTQSGNAMTRKHWDRVAHLACSDTIKGYYAANLDLEDALTHLVSELEKKGIADRTVICLSTDHFPYGLDSDAPLGKMPYLSELYGENVTTYMQRDHSRLILWSGSLEDKDPIIVDSPTFSLDILPTLSNLFGTEYDSRLLPGRDVFSEAEALVFNMNYDWKTELGTYIAASGKFIPKDDTVVLPDDYVKNMKAVVRNKIRYCDGVLDNDYFAKLFG